MSIEKKETYCVIDFSEDDGIPKEKILEMCEELVKSKHFDIDEYESTVPVWFGETLECVAEDIVEKHRDIFIGENWEEDDFATIAIWKKGKPEVKEVYRVFIGLIITYSAKEHSD